MLRKPCELRSKSLPSQAWMRLQPQLTPRMHPCETLKQGSKLNHDQTPNPQNMRENMCTVISFYVCGDIVIQQYTPNTLTTLLYTKKHYSDFFEEINFQNTKFPAR